MSRVLVFLALALSVSLAQASRPRPWNVHQATCPNLENIVRDAVYAEFSRDRTLPAGVLRLHFHDCFVNGCDASLLLESTPTDGRDVERFARGNDNSARGFEVIDVAKTKVEANCPGLVSCADILAMAARDAVVYMGGPNYTVPTGRFDGRVSSRTIADSFLPSPGMNATQLKRNFQGVGLSSTDLVVLSGGHTLGTSKCTFFENRAYNFNGTNRPDPSMNPEFVTIVRGACPNPGASPSPAFPLDSTNFRFDNAYYRDLVNRNGVLTSDQVLANDAETGGLVIGLSRNQNQFFDEFVKSMRNMGNIAWKTRANGEIRRVCTAVNGARAVQGGHSMA